MLAIPPPPWSATQTQTRASYGGLCGGACLQTSRGMWRLRHARALAWRRGPVRACVRACAGAAKYQIFTYIHTAVHSAAARSEDLGFILGSTRGHTEAEDVTGINSRVE